MPRVKRGVAGSKGRKRTLKRAKGFYGGRSKLYSVAIEAVEKADKYAYRDRKQRKRDFRGLWIARINAAARTNGTTYSRLISGLKSANVALDRKILSELAIVDAAAFSKVVASAKK